MPEDYWELKTLYRNVTFNVVSGKYKKEELLSEDAVGVVNGLAWTRVGGEILQVEAALDSIRFNCCDACIEPAVQNATQLLYEIEKTLKEL